MRWGCLGIAYWVEFGVACCLMRLSVIYDKYAIQSRKRKMWLLSFRKITVKSYSVENLNMSREEERKASGSEAAGRGQCFPCLFSKFWVGWGLVYNEKDNNGMMTLFSFHPVRRSARRDCGYGRISVHLISRFFWNAMRLCSQCSRQFLRVRLWCLKKNATRNRIGALWQICTYQHSSSNKTGSADVYQTIGCVFFKSFVVCLKRQTPSSCRKKKKIKNLTVIFMALVVCWKTGGRTISLTCALNRLVPPFSLKVIKAAGGTVDTENCEL